MKLMIASDIHGSAMYCKNLMEAFDREKADRLLLLGDILYHGPRNDLPEEYAPKKVISMLNDVRDRLIYATHGHNFNLNNLPPLCRGDILLHGHTHIPAWEEFGENNLYLNPGSVSIPKENSTHGYMLLENEEFIWETLDGEEYHSLKI